MVKIYLKRRGEKGQIELEEECEYSQLDNRIKELTRVINRTAVELDIENEK